MTAAICPVAYEGADYQADCISPASDVEFVVSEEKSVGGQLGSERPIMTVWHGGQNDQVQVFSGFQLWYWRREQQIAIADWVLQNLWGIPRANVPR